MSDQLYASHWAPLHRALKSKFNLFVLVLGLFILGDWMMGAPLATKILVAWYKFRAIDIQGSRFLSVFGTFSKLNDMALVFDKFLSWFFIGVTGLSYLWGLVQGLVKR